jgi:hypothetical protein
MATNDDILRERQQMWGSVTRLITGVTIAVAIILLLMRIFLV